MHNPPLDHVSLGHSLNTALGSSGAIMNNNTTLDIANKGLDFINPFHMPLAVFLAVMLAKFLAEMLLDWIITTVLEFAQCPKLPTRYPVQLIKGLEKFGSKDHAFLVMNQFVEFIFIQHLVYVIFMIDSTSKDPNPYGFAFINGVENLTPLNSLVAFYLIFYVDDFMYYWAHRIMHMRQFYALVHKHHHRQIMPERGYFDAANESPIESAIGLGLIWITFHIVSRVTGIHIVTGILFFPFYATGAVLNHTVYDVKLGPVALSYNVRAHESHHRFSMGNYGQNTMLWDKVFGTYLEYRSKLGKDE